MSENHHHAILLVDDEESITKALQRLFRREKHEIYTALGGEEGLSILRGSVRPFSLIVSDQMMPGMSGVEFFEKAREISPNTIRILLTGYSDMKAVIDAINRGQIHRYMTKPWSDEEMLLVARQALEQYDLVMQNLHLLEKLTELNRTLEAKVEERSCEILIKNRELSKLNQELEQNLYNAVKAFSSLVERHSTLAGHGRRVAQLSRQIGRLLDLPEKELIQIEISALLHDFGKLTFPPRLLDYREAAWTLEERRLYRMHPKLGQDTVHFIGKLDYVGLLIRSHHERYDGLGYPDQLSEEEIPIGARVITVADAYDKVANLRIDADGSVKTIRSSGGRLPEEEVYQRAAVMHLRKESQMSYDPEIVKRTLNYLKDKGTYREDRKIGMEEIIAGMVLARPLYSTGGRFLLPAETLLSDTIIRKIRIIHENDYIDGIYIIRK